MDDTQLLRGVASPAANYAAGIERGYRKMVKRVGKGEADKWRANAIASAPMYETGLRLAGQRYMSREGSKPSGADSTGETGADVCEARPPWRGHSAGVSSGKP